MPTMFEKLEANIYTPTNLRFVGVKYEFCSMKGSANCVLLSYKSVMLTIIEFKIIIIAKI